MQTRLGVLLSTSGETTEAFIDRYRRTCNELLEETGLREFESPDLSTMTVTRWRNGSLKGLPRRPAPAVLKRMFPQWTALDLLTPADLDGDPPRTAGRTIDESDLEMDARRAAEHAAQAASSNLPSMTIDQVEDDALALASDYHLSPPFTVYGRGNQLLATVTNMLDRTKIVTQQGRLYRVAGQTSAVLATASFDLGAADAARSFARSAAMYAQVIEDGPLRAFALGNLAILAYWSGRPAQAVQYVLEAQAQPGLGDTARRRLAAIAARAYAHTGNTMAARQAAEAALVVDTGITDDLHDGIGGEFGFSRRRAVMSNATTHLLLGDGSAAEQAAREAIGLMREEQAAGRLSPQEDTDLAQAAIDLGRARLLAGEFDGAVEAVDGVFNLPPQWRVEGITQRARTMRQELARPGISAPPQPRAEFTERIEDYVSVAARSQLGTPAIG